MATARPWAAPSSTAVKFDWMAHAEKFPGLCTPDESYHGVTYAEKFGKEGLDAMFNLKEPKTGTDGTLSWTVDIFNPATEEDFVLGLKILAHMLRSVTCAPTYGFGFQFHVDILFVFR